MAKRDQIFRLRDIDHTYKKQLKATKQMNRTAILCKILGTAWVFLVGGSALLAKIEVLMPSNFFRLLDRFFEPFYFPSLRMTLIILVPGIVLLICAKVLTRGDAR